jgi:hypothetical protein
MNCLRIPTLLPCSLRSSPCKPSTLQLPRNFSTANFSVVLSRLHTSFYDFINISITHKLPHMTSDEIFIIYLNITHHRDFYDDTKKLPYTGSRSSQNFLIFHSLCTVWVEWYSFDTYVSGSLRKVLDQEGTAYDHKILSLRSNNFSTDTPTHLKKQIRFL